MFYHQKYVFQKKQKIKAFNIATNRNEAKAMTENISCDCECKFNSTVCNSNQKSVNETCHKFT